MTLTSWRSSRNCAYSDIQLSRCNPSHISNVYTQQIVQQVGVKQVKRQCESESKEEFSQKRRRGKWLFSVRGKRTWTHKPEMSNHLLLVLKSFSSDYVLCVFEFKMNDFLFLYIFFFQHHGSRESPASVQVLLSGWSQVQSLFHNRRRVERGAKQGCLL